MRYFTIAELCESEKAKALKIDNTPSAEVIENLSALICNTLDPVRVLWGSPIGTNSGFRCKALNIAVKGSKTSQHMKGEASDITTRNRESNIRLFNMIKNSNIPFDQLILENGGQWIHISYSRKKNRREVKELTQK